jgi:hypothetical protein
MLCCDSPYQYCPVKMWLDLVKPFTDAGFQRIPKVIDLIPS